MHDFLLRALAAGVGVALIAAPLGCFVVWRRMAYFGAALSHSALLGIAVGLVIGLDVRLGILAVSPAVALLLLTLQRQRQLPTDTLLGILAHGTLAFGLIVISTMESLRVDLLGYLFGDILAVAPIDLIWIYAGGAVCLGSLAALWRPLLASTVHEDIARVEGVRTHFVEFAFLMLLSLVIAIAMQIVGVLLIVSLLIIPAATARKLAVTPEQMAVFAGLVGCASVGAGLLASLAWDAPAGPAIVVAAVVLFAVTHLVAMRTS